MPSHLSDWVIVFDLDDTLYKEADYVKSGIIAVASMLKNLYQIDLTQKLLEYQAAGNYDLWGYACELLHLPNEAKESLIWFYRLHIPRITLECSVHAFLANLQGAGATLAILTDGRAITQRLKLNALGLAHLPVFISEEFGSMKPNPQRFLHICTQWPGKRYLYLADNPAKDFEAPNALRWITIGLRDNGRNIHNQKGMDAELSLPMLWIDDILELEKIVAG